MKRHERKPLYHYWTPNHWPAWIGFAFLRASCFLPYPWQIGLGKAIGRLAHRIGAERRAIARRNIELCFPELTKQERDKLAREHFEALGVSIMEMGLGRWASDKKMTSLTNVIGLHHLQETLDQGFGVLLVSAHFTTLEVCGRAICQHTSAIDGVYRRFRSGLMTEFLATTREVTARKMIEKNDLKSMIRSLREGTIVWYAPDQSYDGKQSALVPFFGVPAMTNTATSTLAKLGKAKALPFFPMRLPEGGYEIRILAPIENFPSDDAIADTEKFVALLEEQIRRCPEQYYWVHRKFKRRPDPLPDVYADLDALK
jgi:KDO2-lipid IV(A) lauroyltransferase